jgi:hypothetical protein
MQRRPSPVLALLLVLAFAGAAFAVPDPNLSTVTLIPVSSNLVGIATCPNGDARPFDYIEVIVMDVAGAPMVGIPATLFTFWVSGGNVNIYNDPSTPMTDNTGRILFSVQANEAIPYGSGLTIQVEVYGVILGTAAYLPCNTFDYDNDGDIDPVDFSVFASDFTTVTLRSDFDWSGGTVNPIDFSIFAAHW